MSPLWSNEIYFVCNAHEDVLKPNWITEHYVWLLKIRSIRTFKECVELHEIAAHVTQFDAFHREKGITEIGS